MTRKPNLSALNGHKSLCLGKKNQINGSGEQWLSPTRCAATFSQHSSPIKAANFPWLLQRLGKKKGCLKQKLKLSCDEEFWIKSCSTLEASMWVCIPAGAFGPGVSFIFISCRPRSHWDFGVFRVSPLLGTQSLLHFPCGYDLNVKLKSSQQ